MIAHINVTAGANNRMVTDQDIRFDEPNLYKVFSQHHSSTPIPILLLGPHQRMIMTLYAYKAAGRVHAKFSAAAAVSLQPK